MSAEIKIPESARADLREQLAPEVAIEVAECMLAHAVDAANTVAREYDEDAGDDQNWAGFTVARRAKNLAARDLRKRKLEDVIVRATTGFTWNIVARGTQMHTYSAAGGLDNFQLGGSDRKAGIVDRSMEQLALFDASGTKSRPNDLVMAYTRSAQGLQRACLGVMRSETDFAWQVLIYDADGGELGVVEERARDRGPSFREQPEEEAEVTLKDPAKKHENL